MSGNTAVGEALPSLTHLGLLYDTPADLVRSAAPRLHAALRQGAAVAAFLDPPTTRKMTEALGPAAAGVAFEDPASLPGAVRGGFLRRVHDRTPRHDVVLTQYSAMPFSDTDVATEEAGINVMLADRPITVLCACDRAASPGRMDSLYRSHPRLVSDGTEADNPAFRTPDAHSPTPAATWGGTHVLRVPFGSTEDLRRIRRRVEAVVHEAGLHGEAAREAVLAVHEAAVLACDEVRTLHPVLRLEGRRLCVVDVWAGGGHLVVEVAGPRGVADPDPEPPPEAAGADRFPAARLPRNRFRVAGPLRYIRMFCREVAMHDSGLVRTVRVVI